MQENNIEPDLDRWFSAARMSTYRRHDNFEQLYVWNTRLSKTFLEDIQHVEILLCNWIDSILSSDKAYGERWFENSAIPFNRKAKRSVEKAIRRAGGSSANSGKVIAELSLDFWRFLLTKKYQTTIWPKLQKSLPKSVSRVQFEKEVITFYDFRNRAAHHEPLIKPNYSDEIKYLDRISHSIWQTASWISPGAAIWIEKYSQVDIIRAERP